MKKRLKSKRYLRSRASVQVGREKRRIRKALREVETWNNFINFQLPQLVNSAIPEVIRLLQAVEDAFLQAAQAFVIPMQEIVRTISENPEEFSRRFHELSVTQPTNE
jgi:hypothetical protein